MKIDNYFPDFIEEIRYREYEINLILAIRINTNSQKVWQCYGTKLKKIY